MTNTFKAKAIEVLATPTNLYTCPGATSAVIHTLSIGNKDAVNPAVVTIEFFDGTNTFILGANIPIPVGSTLVFDKPINLEPTHQINITADGINKLVAFASILEIT